MDRNSAIGLTLIAALLLGYFYWFAPSPQPASQPVKTENQSAAKLDTVARNSEVTNDSLLAASYGNLSSFAQGAEKTIRIETEDIIVTFTNKGGLIHNKAFVLLAPYGVRVVQ